MDKVKAMLLMVDGFTVCKPPSVMITNSVTVLTNLNREHRVESEDGASAFKDTAKQKWPRPYLCSELCIPVVDASVVSIVRVTVDILSQGKLTVGCQFTGRKVGSFWLC